MKLFSAAVWGALLSLGLSWSAPAQSLVFDNSISGYFVARATNSIASAGEADAFSFDALAGDLVSIAVDSPDSNLDPFVELRNSANGLIASDEDSGPGPDALISAFVIGSSGTYSVRILGRNSTTGAYQLRVDLARTVQLETDANYSNDTIASANLLRKSPSGIQAKVTVVGTIMATGPAGTADAGDVDEDVFDLGRLNPGNVVELTVRLPAGSTLAAKATLISGSGAVVLDDDGNLTNGHFHGTVGSGGNYYARLEANSGAGPNAQYALDVTINDLVPPRVASVTRLPSAGAVTDRVISTFTVTFDESLSPAGSAWGGRRRAL